MRTLHVEMGRHRLGGTMQVFYLLRGLKARNIPAALICPEGSPLHHMAQNAGIEVFAIPYAGDLDLRFPFRMASIIRAFQPDIIHLHSRRGADTLGLLSAHFTGRAKVILSRRIDDPLRSDWLTRWRFQKLADHIIAVSKGIVWELEKAGVDRSRISQVYSAIDVPAYQSTLSRSEALGRLGLAEDASVVAVIGQLIPRKGHRYLLEAAPGILDEHPDTHFVFLGEGEEEQRLRHQVQSLGIEKHVLFAGYRQDVADILRGVDVLVHPATMEGFANVALQAMAAGVPVVSTAVGGMPESVRDGINGLLVPPRSAEALGQAVRTLLRSPELRATLGENGRRIVTEEFHVDAMVEGNLAVYRKLLGGV